MRAFLFFGLALIGAAMYTQVSIFDGISNGAISADTTMAATRSYDPSKPSEHRSAWICFKLRRCFRDLFASVLSQDESLKAY